MAFLWWTHHEAVKSITTSLFPLRAAEFKTESISESDGVKSSPPRILLTVLRLTPKTFFPGQLVDGVGVPVALVTSQSISDREVDLRIFMFSRSTINGGDDTSYIQERRMHQQTNEIWCLTAISSMLENREVGRKQQNASIAWTFAVRLGTYVGTPTRVQVWNDFTNRCAKMNCAINPREKTSLCWSLSLHLLVPRDIADAKKDDRVWMSNKQASTLLSSHQKKVSRGSSRRYNSTRSNGKNIDDRAIKKGSVIIQSRDGMKKSTFHSFLLKEKDWSPLYSASKAASMEGV